jgi:hypothetical protein
MSRSIEAVRGDSIKANRGGGWPLACAGDPHNLPPSAAWRISPIVARIRQVLPAGAAKNTHFSQISWTI